MKADRPGVALMLVLWLVVVLAATGAVAVSLSRSEANTVLAYRSRVVARAAAESGIEAGLAALRRGLRESPAGDRAGVVPRVAARLERTGPQVVGDGRFQVAVEDLTGRIPINAADYGTLLRLFTLAAGPERAPSLADATLDWIDPDDRPRPSGAESARYEELGAPFRPLNRPFQRIEEVARLPGVDDSLAAVLEQNVTVYGRGLINVNSAPPLALAAATGMPLEVAERLVRLRRDRPFQGMDEVRSAMGTGAGFVPVSLLPTRLLLVSRGWLDGRSSSREIRAVVELDGWTLPGGPTLAVVGWEERDR